MKPGRGPGRKARAPEGAQGAGWPEAPPRRTSGMSWRGRRAPCAGGPAEGRRSGYTLLEVLVGIGLLMALSLPLFGLQSRLLLMARRTRQVAACGVEASKALESILADARASSGVGAGSGDEVLVLLKRYPEEETVTYALDRGALELVRTSSLRGETVVASGLRSVSFQYELLGDEVSFVRVTVDGGGEGEPALRLVGGAELRNRAR